MQTELLSQAVRLLVGVSAFTYCGVNPKSNGLATSVVGPRTRALNQPGKGEVVSELSKKIWVIFQDKKNNYWFGSDGQGVYRSNGKTITRYSTKDGLLSDRIREIKEDRSGNIFISTLDGISKFDVQTFTTLAVKSSESKWRLHPNDLWFKGASKEPGPLRYDGKSLYQLKFPKHYLEEQNSKATPDPVASPYAVYTIYKDTKGNLWFGTANLGACRYDGKSLTWIYERHLSEVEGGGSFGIRTIGEDKSGKFWICTNRNRYLIRAGKRSGNDSIIDYKSEPGISHIMGKKSYEPIFFESMARDDSRNLWMSSNSSGVWRFDGRELKRIPAKTERSWMITLYKDNRGEIWLGTDGAGVFKFDGKEFKPFQPRW